MKKKFWNKRFDTPDYLYGREPNQFFREQLRNYQPGKLLLPADGEGRNGVYAAARGWQVVAFDHSEVARGKALALAEEHRVTLAYQLSSIENFTGQANHYDLIGLFYLHLLPDQRRDLHRRVIDWLKPGGSLILEAFSKDQMPFGSGGPKNIEMLFDPAMLGEDFAALEIQRLEKRELDLSEGPKHSGPASVMRLVGRKLTVDG